MVGGSPAQRARAAPCGEVESHPDQRGRAQTAPGPRAGRAARAPDRRHAAGRVARHEPHRRRRPVPARLPPALGGAHVSRAVAPNPGPYTGPVTNTWIVDAGPLI